MIWPVTWRWLRQSNPVGDSFRAPGTSAEEIINVNHFFFFFPLSPLYLHTEALSVRFLTKRFIGEYDPQFTRVLHTVVRYYQSPSPTNKHLFIQILICYSPSLSIINRLKLFPHSLSPNICFLLGRKRLGIISLLVEPFHGVPSSRVSVSNLKGNIFNLPLDTPLSSSSMFYISLEYFFVEKSSPSFSMHPIVIPIHYA